MKLGDTIKELLAQNAITQKRFADILHIPPSTLGNYIQNTREPDYDTLIRIADYFHVSIDFLLNHPSDSRLAHSEEQLLHVFRSLSEEQQEFYLEQGKIFIRQNKAKGREK